MKYSGHHNLTLRRSDCEISNYSDILVSNSPLKELLDSLPEHVMLLNSTRQIVYANPTLKKFAQISNQQTGIGLRLGELFSCDHAQSAVHGCGTAASCATCGALASILAALDGEKSNTECRIVRKQECGQSVIDFRVWATPLILGIEPCVLVIAKDITEEKRLQFLEQKFLHDIKNTALSLHILTTLLSDGDMTFEEGKHELMKASDMLLAKIEQKQLRNDAGHDVRNADDSDTSPSEHP